MRANIRMMMMFVVGRRRVLCQHCHRASPVAEYRQLPFYIDDCNSLSPSDGLFVPSHSPWLVSSNVSAGHRLVETSRNNAGSGCTSTSTSTQCHNQDKRTSNTSVIAVAVADCELAAAQQAHRPVVSSD